MSPGRANKYQTHIEPYLEVILGWMRSGYTEASIAKRLGVGKSTWERYKATRQEFREHIRKGQQDVAALCVNNLVKRANGYDYDEIHTEITDGGQQGQRGAAGAGQLQASQRRVFKKIIRHVPPDVAANCVIIFNRMASKWQNTQYIKHTGEVKGGGVLLTAPPMDKDAWLRFYDQNVKEPGSQGQATATDGE